MRVGKRERERQDAGAARQTDIDGRMGTERGAGLRDSHMRCSRSFTTYLPRARGARRQRERGREAGRTASSSLYAASCPTEELQ